jgi:Uma2 family endonuclease
MMNVNSEHIELLASAPLRPLKRVEFERLAQEGYFEEENVELLLGIVVEMAKPDPAHDESTDLVFQLLMRGVGERARVRCQGSFAATDDSLPQPDVYVMPPGSYWKERPSRAYLVVEVARSSLRRDRGVKSAIYGLAEVDEYWIVNHIDRCVEIHRESSPDGWQIKLRAYPGETIAPLAFPDVTIAVSEILPP